MSLAALLAAGLVPVQAAGPQTFSIPAGPADHAVNRLAAQAGIDVVITADLRRRRTRGLAGRMSVETALERLLGPLGARAVRIGPGMYRVEAAPAPRDPRRSAAEPRPPAPPPPALLSEVVVTAMPPVGTPGAQGRLIDPGALRRFDGAAASDGVADLSATVDSTRQGTGRNKLFIRGLADSAMNGPLQATVGQYYGDLRLGFGSPDPDLTLVDIRRVEVFEGPQGSRFGSGSIGGVLRLQPEPPRMQEASLRLVAGAGETSGGGGSAEAAAITNLPMGADTAARLVVYGRREGGFLDDPASGEGEADAVDTAGARASLRWSHDGWTVDLVGLVQRVAADDAQTVVRGETGLKRTGGVPEPYESTFLLAGVTARRRLGPATVVSATSLSRQVLEERFDATRPNAARLEAVDRLQTATTVASELRFDLSSRADWTLTGGAVIAAGETRVTRRHRDLGPKPVATSGADLRRNFAEATVFGEASIAPAPRWRLAIGGRLSAVRLESDLRDIGAETRGDRERDGTTVRFTPAVSARWDASAGTALFARLERLVRPAGVGEANGAFERYDGDRVTLVEAGARSRRPWHGVTAEVSVGWVDWRDVQADIVTPGGDLVTDNVGDGTIRFVSLKGAWSPGPSLDVSGGLFINDSALTPTRPNVIVGGRTDIPNVAPVGAQLSVDLEAGRLAGLPLRLGADLRYVGQSRLGVGPALDVPQGGYLRSELTARLGDDRRAATLRISNPFDSAGVRYGIGSPYQLHAPQVVPVRPLTIRLTLEAAF